MISNATINFYSSPFIEKDEGIFKSFKIEVGNGVYLQAFPDIVIFYIWLYVISIIGFVMTRHFYKLS